MDFRQTPQASGTRPTPASPAPAAEHKEAKAHKGSLLANSHWMQILQVAILAGIAILLIGIAFSFNRSSGAGEAGYVDGKKYQAVFLNNGQVYFGNISKLNDKYISLKNIYYLTQGSGDNNSSNYSLVKLGCQQIHDPTDQMIINRDQVTFWENLNDNGKVVTSINQFQKQNPNGPDCSQVSNQTQASPSSSQSSQNSTTTGTGTNTTNPSASGTPSNK